jgi:hypothetical protein
MRVCMLLVLTESPRALADGPTLGFKQPEKSFV